MTSGCYFCGQIAGQADHDLIAQLLPDSVYIRRVLLESQAFAAIPSLGPLTAGHALLCPKEHLRSCAATPAARAPEFHRIRVRLRNALERRYECQVLQFEHGMACAGQRILCTVDHGHLHFVPLHGLSEILIPDLPWRPYDGSLHELRRLTDGDEYISLEMPDGTCRVATARGRAFESQFMRRFIAAQTRPRIPWNWRERPNAAAAHATWENVALPTAR